MNNQNAFKPVTTQKMAVAYQQRKVFKPTTTFKMDEEYQNSFRPKN